MKMHHMTLTLPRDETFKKFDVVAFADDVVDGVGVCDRVVFGGGGVELNRASSLPLTAAGSTYNSSNAKSLALLSKAVSSFARPSRTVAVFRGAFDGI